MRLTSSLLSRRDEVLGSETPRLDGGMNTPMSQRSLTLVDPAKISERVLTLDMGKEDLLTQWSNINFTGIDTVAVRGDNGPMGSFILSDNAFEQMCGKLGVPSAYMKKCPVSGRAGRQEQLEYWREQIDDREVMLRVRRNENNPDAGGTLRAVLSKTYEPIDNSRLWTWSQQLLNRFPGQMGVTYASIGETSTHLRLVFTEPLNIGTEQHPDLHYYGLHISDSEVGSKALTVDFLFFRLVCLNGMMTKVEGDHILHTKHIHIDYPTLQREFMASVDTALQHKDTLFNLLDNAKSVNITDPHSQIRRLARHYRFTNDFADKVVEAYEQEPNPTRFGLVQAFTRAARQMPMDRRTDVESIAGQYLIEAA